MQATLLIACPERNFLVKNIADNNVKIFCWPILAYPQLRV